MIRLGDRAYFKAILPSQNFSPPSAITMKKFLKPFGVLVGLYIVVSLTLSGAEAGILTLQIGIKQNSMFLTRVFIALGANPKETGQDGMSALHFAGYLGAEEVMIAFPEKP